MSVRALMIAAAVCVAGCEKATHENIDKWLTTSKGTKKLKEAFANASLEPDLSAHAAENLIEKGLEPDVRAALEAMPPTRRTAVIGELSRRLWEDARIENPDLLPKPEQTQAKDALVLIRKYATPEQRTQIDSYLIDWYAVRSYEKRAGAGANSGATVIRMVGAPAAKKLMAVVNAVITEPGQEKTRTRIHEELMLALALSGSPDAVKYVLDLVTLDRGDRDQPTRAMNQLYAAYVDSGNQFELRTPEPLAPNLAKIVDLAKDPKLPSRVTDGAIGLIRAIGGQACSEQLIGIIPAPHDRPTFKYIAATYALRCGGPAAIGPAFRAMPDPGAYEQALLPGTLLAELRKLAPRDQVLAGLRELVGEKSTVVPWLAIEGLAALKSVEDAPRIAALSRRREKLTGYWGETGKPDPTLGQRAKELADELAPNSGK